MNKDPQNISNDHILATPTIDETEYIYELISQAEKRPTLALWAPEAVTGVPPTHNQRVGLSSAREMSS